MYIIITIMIIIIKLICLVLTSIYNIFQLSSINEYS